MSPHFCISTCPSPSLSLYLCIYIYIYICIHISISLSLPPCLPPPSQVTFPEQGAETRLSGVVDSWTVIVLPSGSSVGAKWDERRKWPGGESRRTFEVGHSSARNERWFQELTVKSVQCSSFYQFFGPGSQAEAQPASTAVRRSTTSSFRWKGYVAKAGVGLRLRRELRQQRSLHQVTTPQRAPLVLFFEALM